MIWAVYCNKLIYFFSFIQGNFYVVLHALSFKLRGSFCLFYCSWVLLFEFKYVFSIQLLFPFCRPGLRSIVTGYLPSVILNGFVYVVPFAMIEMAKLAGYISRSRKDIKACNMVFYFLVGNVFFLSLLSGSLLDQIGEYFSHPRDFPGRLASAASAQVSYTCYPWRLLCFTMTISFYCLWCFIDLVWKGYATWRAFDGYIATFDVTLDFLVLHLFNNMQTCL